LKSIVDNHGKDEHAFLHGVLMYVLEVIMSPFNPSEKFRLDEIVDKLIVPIRSTSNA